MQSWTDIVPDINNITFNQAPPPLRLLFLLRSFELPSPIVPLAVTNVGRNGGPC